MSDLHCLEEVAPHPSGPANGPFPASVCRLCRSSHRLSQKKSSVGDLSSKNQHWTLQTAVYSTSLSHGGFKFWGPVQPRSPHPQRPQPCFLSDKHLPQATVGMTFLLFISTCAITGIAISAAAGTRQSDRYIKNRHGRTRRFRPHAWNARTGVCRPPRLANKDTNFSAFLFSGEQDREQTGEAKAAEMSQGHFNLKKKERKKPGVEINMHWNNWCGKNCLMLQINTQSHWDLITVRQVFRGVLPPTLVTSNQSERLYSWSFICDPEASWARSPWLHWGSNSLESVSQSPCSRLTVSLGGLTGS